MQIIATQRDDVQREMYKAEVSVYKKECLCFSMKQVMTLKIFGNSVVQSIICLIILIVFRVLVRNKLFVPA